MASKERSESGSPSTAPITPGSGIEETDEDMEKFFKASSHKAILERLQSSQLGKNMEHQNTAFEI